MITLDHAQSLLNAFAGNSDYKLEKVGNRVWFSWEGWNGKKHRRCWNAQEGSHFSSWSRPFGGTMTCAVDSIIRALQGKSIAPRASLMGLVDGPAKLGQGRREQIVKALEEANWPEEVPCFFCGKLLKSYGDWFTRGPKGNRKSGPACTMRGDCEKKVPQTQEQPK